MIAVTRGYECSDARDKIYALQGLVVPEFAQNIIPDYTKSAIDAPMSVYLDHIKTTKDLFFLSQCNSAARPTWVADLERTIGSVTLNAVSTPFTQAPAYLVESGILEVTGVLGDELLCNPLPLPYMVGYKSDL